MPAKHALLIIGYQRVENILTIVDIARKVSVGNIIVYLDGSKANDDELLSKQKDLVTRLSISRGVTPSIDVVQSKFNRGCAASVLTAIDYAFNKFENVYILEDDCIPDPSFFAFCDSSLAKLLADDSLWLTCGSQFVPEALTHGYAFESKYPFTWGWFTTRAKWTEIRKAMFSPSTKPAFKNISRVEKRYWSAGRNRALTGITDVWDTVLVFAMLRDGKRALLPPVNLVINVGNDEFATHTGNDSIWISRPAKPFVEPIRLSSDSYELEKWVYKNVFHISSRHLITTRITQILDLLHLKKRKFKSNLALRINLPGIN